MLDLGCGTGRWSIPIARAGLAVVGVDRSREMIARLLAKPGAALAPVVLADATRLPFRGAFDAVVLSHFLHLVPSLDAVAEGLRPVLRPGARLLVVDFTYLPRPTSDRVLAAVMPRLEGRFRPQARGDRSRDRALLQDLAGHLGAGPVEALPCSEFASARSLRQNLSAARERVWSVLRAHDAEAVRCAVDAAERELLNEGADLDEMIDEPIGARLLVATLA